MELINILKTTKLFGIICDSFVLRFATEEIKNNKEIVLKAVKKRGMSLEYASLSLRENKEIVTAAVRQNGNAFIFASDELKKNQSIAICASKQDVHIYSQF